jgi:4-hydroxybenzoate polyprenyltransferase
MLIILFVLFVQQKRLINNKQYLDAFKFNNWIGMVASLGFIVETFLV